MVHKIKLYLAHFLPTGYAYSALVKRAPKPFSRHIVYTIQSSNHQKFHAFKIRPYWCHLN